MSEMERLQVEIDEIRNKMDSLIEENQKLKDLILNQQVQINQEKTVTTEMRKTLIPTMQEVIRWHEHRPNGLVLWSNIPEEIRKKEEEARVNALIQKRNEEASKQPKKPL
jgi:hypothetical protein